jgi:hypothetical protein
MPISVIALLLLAAFLCTIVAAAGRCPVWVPVLLVVLVQMLQLFPR